MIKLEYDGIDIKVKKSESYSNFEKFFNNKTGFNLTTLQSYWAFKSSIGLSFSVVSPTGTGKSLFGITWALFNSERSRLCYIVLPTTALVIQFSRKLMDMGAEDLIFFHSGLKKKEKEEVLNKIRNKSFKILLSTTSFLAKHYSDLSSIKFDFIFVDDVDALLKASKNVERVLTLLGYSNKEIQKLTPHQGSERGQLILSTATSKPGRKAGIFVKLMGFSIGQLKYTVREITDILIETEKSRYKEILKALISKLGYGGIIFAPSQKDAEKLEKILGGSFKAIYSGIDINEREKIIKDFKDKKIQGLIGVTGAYSLLSRGLDLPYNIAYSIFYGPPESITAYIQGSGRTSRLTPYGITKGLSIVIGEKESLDNFERVLLINDFDLKRIPAIESINWENIIRELWNSRNKNGYVFKEIIKPYLLIVESPTKARQISSFFGKPAYNVYNNQIFYETAVNDMVLIITASIGHIVDLHELIGFYGVKIFNNQKFIPVYGPIKRCSRDNQQFVGYEKCPICNQKPDSDTSERINNIVNFASAVKKVILCSDPDREGEKISFDIKNFCANYAETFRAEFHEVTKKALLKALASPGNINERLVDAQICRRIEDRWIGFTLSSILKLSFNEKNLSAGRAQSPVLNWIVKRTEEYFKRKKVLFIRIEDNIIELGENLRIKPGTVKAHIEKRDSLIEEKVPLPPFSTDSLLRELNRLLHLDVSESMKILQQLFESGLITYHRTDSTRVSDLGYNIARLWLNNDFLYRKWGNEDSAHECIRPTKPLSKNELIEEIKNKHIILQNDIKNIHFKVYDIIFRRFMASFCPKTKLLKNIYAIRLDNMEKTLERYVKAEGKAYEIYPWAFNILSPLPEGEVNAEVFFKKIPLSQPYTQAEIIHEMKRSGIGRPSTYATIIDRLFQRRYIINKGGKVFATEKGKRINSFLFENYRQFVSQQRTAQLEEKMDKIEHGLLSADKVLSELYNEIQKIMTY